MVRNRKRILLWFRLIPTAPARGGLSAAARMPLAPQRTKPMMARESFFAADSTSSAAKRRALSAPFFLPRQEVEPFTHGAEVAWREVRDGEKAPPLVRAQLGLEIPLEKLDLPVVVKRCHLHLEREAAHDHRVEMLERHFAPYVQSVERGFGPRVVPRGIVL